MGTYIVTPKVGNSITIEAFRIEAKEGALFLFDAAGSPIAIFPLAELYGVLEEETMKAMGERIKQTPKE